MLFYLPLTSVTQKLLFFGWRQIYLIGRSYHIVFRIEKQSFQWKHRCRVRLIRGNKIFLPPFTFAFKIHIFMDLAMKVYHKPPHFQEVLKVPDKVTKSFLVKHFLLKNKSVTIQVFQEMIWRLILIRRRRTFFYHRLIRLAKKRVIWHLLSNLCSFYPVSFNWQTFFLQVISCIL